MDDIKLYNLAFKAKEMAYAPYSDFKVGAAVLTADGSVFTGFNIENASYSATMCAERVAIFKAVSEGKGEIVKIAVASNSEDYTYPCGVCLQVIGELAPKAHIILARNNSIKVFTLNVLLPYSFTNDHLK